MVVKLPPEGATTIVREFASARTLQFLGNVTIEKLKTRIRVKAILFIALIFLHLVFEAIKFCGLLKIHPVESILPEELSKR